QMRVPALGDAPLAPPVTGSVLGRDQPEIGHDLARVRDRAFSYFPAASTPEPFFINGNLGDWERRLGQLLAARTTTGVHLNPSSAAIGAGGGRSGRVERALRTLAKEDTATPPRELANLP